MEMEFGIAAVLALIIIGSSYETQLNSDVREEVSKNLFTMLNKKSNPIADSKKVPVPPIVMNLYKKMVKEYKEKRIGNTIRIYSHKESSIDQRFLHSHRFRLYFNVADLPETEIIASTQLTLSVLPKEDHDTQRVDVYDIVQPGIKGETKPLLRLIDTQLVNSTPEATLMKLDIMPAVKRWISSPENNHGLLINALSVSNGSDPIFSHVRLKRSTDDGGDQSWNEVQPLLLVHTKDANSTINIAWMNNSGRPKRDTAAKSRFTKTRHRGECRRHKLWVDFRELGWDDWIEEPKGYEAYYCAGYCPSEFADHLNATNHAIVQSLMHSRHLNIPRPCCIPTELSSVHLLHWNENNKIVVKKYENMVVEACGCR